MVKFNRYYGKGVYYHVAFYQLVRNRLMVILSLIGSSPTYALFSLSCVIWASLRFRRMVRFCWNCSFLLSVEEIGTNASIRAVRILSIILSNSLGKECCTASVDCVVALISASTCSTSAGKKPSSIILMIVKRKTRFTVWRVRLSGRYSLNSRLYFTNSITFSMHNSGYAGT